MSSPSEIAGVTEKIDAIVLAGAQGSKPFELKGQACIKPLLELGGEPLVRRVTRAVLGARRVGKVFVVGPADALQQALGPLLAEAKDRVRLIPEGDDILENCYRAFFLNLLSEGRPRFTGGERLDIGALDDYRSRYPEHRDLPALVVTSDLPFLSASAVDHFLEQDPGDAAVVMGVVDHREIELMHRTLEEKPPLERWKLGALQIGHHSVRLSNLFLVRPLHVEPSFYRLLVQLYTHRWLLNQDGSVNFRNWWAMARAAIGYSLRLRGKLRFLRGVLNFVPAAIAAVLARVLHRFARFLSWPFRLLVRKRDLEFIGTLMMGAKAFMAIGRDPGPAIDIDVPESYYTLAQDGEQKFQRILHYLQSANRTAD